MTQRITSKDTCVRKIPMVYKQKQYFSLCPTILDIGCGKYFEDIRRFANVCYGATVFGYDPYNLSAKRNAQSLKNVLMCHNRAVDMVICANVLNVLDRWEDIVDIVDFAAACTSIDGCALFQIYEGDRSGIGKETTKGWQRNQKTEDYLAPVYDNGFGTVIRKGNIIYASYAIPEHCD
jgi:hypothetical protein